MRVIIEYEKSEEKKAKSLQKDLKQLHNDFGGFPECATATMKKVDRNPTTGIPGKKKRGLKN